MAYIVSMVNFTGGKFTLSEFLQGYPDYGYPKSNLVTSSSNLLATIVLTSPMNQRCGKQYLHHHLIVRHPKSNLGRGCQLDNDKADSIDFIQIIEQSTIVTFCKPWINSKHNAL